MKSTLLNLLLALLFTTGCSRTEEIKVVFEGDMTEHTWAIKTLNPDLPSDWSSYNFLTFEMRSTTAQRWFLKIYDTSGVRQLRMQPFQGAWIRISIPLEYIKRRNIKGPDEATMGKISLLSTCIGFTNSVGPVNHVDSIGIQMRQPIGSQTIEIRNVRLSMIAEDAVIEPKPLVDEFGQWIPEDGPGLAKSLAELQTDWKEEETRLQSDDPGYSKYGGYLETQNNATGFFRVEKINDRWWFIDPEGHQFFSNGMTCMNAWCDTRYTGREDIFAAVPPEFTNSRKLGTFSDTKLMGREGDKSYYTWNLYRRFGERWNNKWIDLTIRRMKSWGMNTVGKWSDPELEKSGRIPYVTFLKGWGIETGIMGMPDIYALDYVTKVDSAAAVQCGTRRNDPFLVGYLIGQEPPWVNRIPLLVDAILNGPESSMQNELKNYLSEGDTPERRRTFMYDSYSKFLEIINNAIRKYDPNHLVLGYGFAGSTPSEIIDASKKCFDIFSFTNFAYVANLKEIEKIYSLTGLPVIIGEFHFGTAGRGLAPGLVQTKNLAERGVAYRYYVENTAIHPAIIGIHWFQYVDQPATGRMDGENYNTGMIDITDRPYEDMVEAMKETNKRLLMIHSGKESPVSRTAIEQ